MTNLIIKIDNIVPEIHEVRNIDLAETNPLRVLEDAGLIYDNAQVKVRKLQSLGNIAYAVHVEVTPDMYPLPENFVMIKVFGDGTMFELFNQLETILE